MQQIDAEILANDRLAPDIVRLTLRAPAIARQARPGQFVTVKSGPGFDPLLRRPFSIHQVTADGQFQVLFKVLGQGTQNLSALPAGASLNLVGSLGRPFAPASGPVCLVGGGLGIAPLLFLARDLKEGNPGLRMELILGARNGQELSALATGFAGLGLSPHLATDDGSLGHHGLVTDLLPSVLGEALDWQLRCCGPYPMMRAVAALSRARRWPCQVSLETMMACGISACLGCAVSASPERGGSDGRYLHVCKDGPVFDEGDIAWL